MMGWSFRDNTTLDQLVAYLVESNANTSTCICTTLDYDVEKEGEYHVLWRVVQLKYPYGCQDRHFPVGHNLTYIRCDLLDENGRAWGFKDMREEEHPFYFSCPLRFLVIATHGIDSAWRKKVRQYHADKTKPRQKKPLSRTVSAAV